MRLINWNIERRGPQSWQAQSIVSEVLALSPDLLFFTEAHTNSFEQPGWHTVDHPGYDSETKKPSERLVLMGARSPWDILPVPYELHMAGGIVLGRTVAGGRKVTCLCICIPYHMSKRPEEDKTKPWAHHTSFLKLLAPWLADLRRSATDPLLVVGDFNRRIPRNWGPIAAYKELEDCFEGFSYATAGTLPPLNEQTIDHVAYSGDVVAVHAKMLDRFERDGRPRSDHHGICVDLKF